MNEKPKRGRSANWETKEKILFKEILKSYFEILNNKSLYCTANEAKKEAWAEITKKYSSICVNRKRSTKQLMIQWKTVKKLMKNEMGIAEESTGHQGSLFLPSESHETSDNIKEFQCFKLESIDSSGDSEEAPNPLEDSDTDDETIIPSTTPHKKASNIQVQVQVLSACKNSSTQTDVDKNTTSNKNGNTTNFTEKTYEDMRYYRDMENNRLEKEHLLRVRTMQEQHNQLMKNLLLQEEILKKQLNKID